MLSTLHPPDEAEEAGAADGSAVSMVAGTGTTPTSTSASEMTVSNSGSFDIWCFEGV